jgi:L-alanine-DL-glutamate epimerase-like enolase superfamily enzyme
MPRRLEVAVESWPISGSFTISRGSKREAVVITATIEAGGAVGRGECVPYPRYGETVEGVVTAIRAMAGPVAANITPAALRRQMPAGAARNALDCALIDLAAKQHGMSVAEMLGAAPLLPIETAYTISLAPPDMMAAAALRAAQRPLLKLKLGGDGDPDRLAAVRAAAPGARLIVDANEGWSERNLEANLTACVAAGVELVEQPLPAGADKPLAAMARPIPVCADESVHVADDVYALLDRYDAVNIKLDKAGGLTEARLVMSAAETHGLKTMVGCMVGTSLAMAPALLLAQRADFVDLDGPLLLAGDRAPGLRYDGSVIAPPPPELWG